MDPRQGHRRAGQNHLSQSHSNGGQPPTLETAPKRRTDFCKHWAKGRCDKGDACTFKHNTYASSLNVSTSSSKSTSKPQGMCQHFVATRRCKFGDSCKFSHDLSTTTGSSKDTNVDNHPLRSLHDLKGNMRSYSRSGFKSLGHLEDFLNLSLKNLSCLDREIQSKAVTLLTENESLGAIRSVAEAIGTPRLTRYPLNNLHFDKHLAPFMKIIVHDAFTQTCVEKNLNLLIKTLYGPDGERASRLLGRLIEKLEQKVEQAITDASKTSVQQDCYLVARILYYIVRYNSDAMAQEEMVSIHSRILQLSQTLRVAPSPLSGSIDNIMSETRAYLLPLSLRGEGQQMSLGLVSPVHERYVQLDRLMDRPGALSSSGPRHDNDFHLIAQIRILPTKAELHSDRPAYLPVNDSVAPHFIEGPARLFDIHFRLLREDMLGPLRISVGVILSRLLPSAPITTSLANPHGQRDPTMASVRLYYHVTVESAEFDKFKGLKFRLRFQQPQRFRSMRPADRKQHWTTMRSLDKGALLCLVSNTPEVECFLTVTDKDETDLGKDQDWSWTNVIVAGRNEHAQEYLLHQLVKNPRARRAELVIVEFPGVLLPAYQSILENLQKRSEHPYIPFANILCPQPNQLSHYISRDQTISVRPPLYALSENFEYDLTPLMRDINPSTPLRLSPQSSIDDTDFHRKLAEATTLDLGQCKGLVAALTQELALIQG